MRFPFVRQTQTLSPQRDPDIEDLKIVNLLQRDFRETRGIAELSWFVVCPVGLNLDGGIASRNYKVP